VVLSQALAALVAAAIDWFSLTLAEPKPGVFHQVARIGLLVHSVCLLTTSGKEEKMIDDFAAAYERLEIVLRIVPPCPTSVDCNEESPLQGSCMRVIKVEPSVQTKETKSSSNSEGSSIGSPKRLCSSTVGGSAFFNESLPTFGSSGRATSMGQVTVVLSMKSADDFNFLQSDIGLNTNAFAGESVHISVRPVLFNLGVL
jgi:hypothetical protein